MMTDRRFPIQYEHEKNASGMTSLAGLPLYIELAHLSGLISAIDQQLTTKRQGWLDTEILLSIILLNLSGADCVDDIDRLAADKGLEMVLSHIATFGMKRAARRAYERRWRKGKTRTFPSVSVIHRFLNGFHHPDEEAKRQEGRAFIPAHNAQLQTLLEVNRTLIATAQQHHPCTTATLDQDATLAATHKRSALYCYQKHKAYQPFNTYWHEQALLLHSEFRDGNVPASFEQLRLLKESLAVLPHTVEKVLLRSDSAGYQENVLRYCAEGKDPRWGVIEFAIAAHVTRGFKNAVRDVDERAWQRFYTDDGIPTQHEWTEVCFVPTWACRSPETVHYRYLALREPMAEQLELEGIEKREDAEQQDKELPFQTIELANTRYKLTGVVTNRDLPGEALIHWHRKRCGDSEHVHHVEKTELAGGQFPSDKFGANAAWWQAMVLSFNLNGC